MKNTIWIGLTLSLALAACQNTSVAATPQQNPASAPAEQAENPPIWDANTVNLKSQKLADQVFAIYDTRAAEGVPKGIPMATSSGFIIGQKGVLVIDTMLNQRLNQQVQDLIRAETDLPIVYAINTSYHGDHMYGNMYLPASTQIIQHQKAKSYMQEHLAADKAFMIENFGKGRGIEEIQIRYGDILVPPGGRHTVDLGDRQIQVMDFGFAQTGGDLFVWDPGSQTLWSGNPLIAQQPALPWLLDGHLLETLNSLQAVYDFIPEGATVVPGHGLPMKKADIQWHLNYLTEVKNQVQDAVAQGLSAEETAQKITMENYRGYQLFDWVHPGLNVPAAYQDLSQK